MLCEKMLQTFLSMSLKILRKALLFQRAFSKRRIYENLISKLLQNALLINKSFWISQNSKNDFKRDFVFKSKLFQVTSLSYKKKRFHFGIKTTSKIVFCSKNICSKKKGLSQVAIELSLQMFGV